MYVHVGIDTKYRNAERTLDGRNIQRQKQKEAEIAFQ